MAVLTHEQLENLWILAGGTRATADLAASIAQAESGGDTSRINNTAYPNLPGYHPPAAGNLREYSVGLWQINLLAHPTYTTTQMLGQVGNANAAVAISNQGRSFGAWSTYTSGAYKQYLQTGGVAAPQPGTVDYTSPAAIAPHAHHGWADLRQSVTRHLPNQLRNSQRVTNRALRMVAHRSKMHGGKR